jgi:hypothetical protein
MKSISYVLKQRLDDIPSDNQYEFIKDKCAYYNRIWDVNRGLLNLSMAYTDLFVVNTGNNGLR